MSKLPSDILIDILLLLDDVKQLYHTITISKHCYTAFQARRLLILGCVFERQLLKQIQRLQAEFPASTQGAPGWVYVARVDRIIRNASLVIGRSTDASDIVALDTAVWRALLSLDCRPGILRGFGLQSISRCIRLGRKDLAVTYTMKMLDLIVDENLLKVDASTGQVCNKSMKNSILQLARMLNEAGLPRTSHDMILQLHKASPLFFDRDLFSMLLTSSRHSPKTMTSLVPFCHNQIEQGRTKGIQEASPYHFRWVRCLITVYVELQCFTDAVSVFTHISQLPANLRAQHDGMYTALAYHLINLLKKHNQPAHALTVYRHVYEYLGALQCTDDDFYIECAKDYAAQLCTMGQNHEALVVLGQLWKHNQQATGECNNELMERCNRDIRWTLGQSYERSGYSDLGNDILDRYERRPSLSLVTV